MKAKAFNEGWVTGQTSAGKRLPALQRKYEGVLRANAKRTRAAYESVTAAAPPPEDASSLLDENALKVSITARTAAERKRMAAAVATPLVGKQKATFFEAPLVTIATAQAEAATKAVRDALTKVISDSLAEGWTVPETANQIETTLTDYASWEAERLARTDLVGISNAISLESARTLGDAAPPFKRWLTAGDDAVRPAHQEANGQTVATGKTFNVDGFPMDHPGDFLAPYDLTMNCRCTQIYLDTADASLAHSFEGGIVEDPIAEAVAASASTMEDEMRDEVRDHGLKIVEGDETVEEIVAASVDFTSGTMVALYPGGPDRLAASDGQPEEDLHVTLCYLPDGVDGNRETLVRWLETIASETPPLSGSIGGMGFFSAGEDGRPVVALPDVVGLNELRTRVLGAVMVSDTTYATNHGFLPHITITYVEEGIDEETPDLLGVPLEFAALSLIEGEERTDFVFASDAADTLEEMTEITAAAFTTDQREKLAKEGVAMKDGSFPIRNRADLANALASLGRAKDPAAAKRHIIARARDLDALSELPEKWGITAAAADLFLDEVDPWYEDLPPDHAPIAPIIEEVEARYVGNTRENHRPGAPLPVEYDSVRAARELGLNGFTASGEASVTVRPGDARYEVVIPFLVDGEEVSAQRYRLVQGTDGSYEPETVTAAAAPLAPPDEWFDDPQLDGPTPLTVTADGRVFGHLGEWGKCHTGIGGRCVMIPHSGNGYADFHNGGLELASGKQIRIGKLTLDTGHAPLQAGASQASAHYDHTGHVGAFVRAGEDQYGPWLAGAVKSDATPEQIRDLRANPPSGDWRKFVGRSGLELIAALAVPVQGFPVAALSASGEVTAFVSGWDDSGDLALVASSEDGLTASNDNHDDRGRFDFGSGKEVGREEAAGLYGGHGFEEGDRVRTPDGALAKVIGTSHSDSQVRVQRESDGVVEDHEPGVLKREGGRASLPARDRGNLVASSDPFEILAARLDGMEGLAALVAAPLSDADLERGLRMIGARLDGIDGLAALVDTSEEEAEVETLDPSRADGVSIENSGSGTIVVNIGAPAAADSLDIGDDELDAEIAYQVDFFHSYGYWPSGAQSGATFTPEQMARVKMLAPLMISDPAAPTSVAIRDRLVRKGLLYSQGA